MGGRVKYIEVCCKDCNKKWMKQKPFTSEKYWSGRCMKCSCKHRSQKQEFRDKISSTLKGRYIGDKNPNWVEKRFCKDCGKELSKSRKGTIRCIKCSGKEKSKEKNPFWKGGITPLVRAIRTSSEYKQWAKSVKERDDYTCQICFVRGGILHSDHIMPFSLFPELRFDLNNGRTLCVECHKKHGWSFFKENNPRKKNVA